MNWITGVATILIPKINDLRNIDIAMYLKDDISFLAEIVDDYIMRNIEEFHLDYNNFDFDIQGTIEHNGQKYFAIDFYYQAWA